MKIKLTAFIISCLLSLSTGSVLNAQAKVWSIDDCIQYALEKNIQVKQAQVSSDINGIESKLCKICVVPFIKRLCPDRTSAGAIRLNNTTGSTVFKGSDGTNISLNSGMTVYNGNRIRNNVKQSEINYEASKYSTEVIKETVSLNVLNAYLQVLYAEEQVKNNNYQISSLEEQLNLAAERFKLGAIANSDYLQVKSQLATEKQTLASSKSQLAINRITLMQLMELTDPGDFSIEHPNLDSLINQKRIPDPKEVYQIALGIKPEVKNAELIKQSSQIGVDLARSDFFPNLSVSAGVSTLYSSGSISGSSFGYQIKNNISPALGSLLQFRFISISR